MLPAPLPGVSSWLAIVRHMAQLLPERNEVPECNEPRGLPEASPGSRDFTKGIWVMTCSPSGRRKDRMETDFAGATKASRAYADRARRSLPGGGTAGGKYFGPHPDAVKEGKGRRLLGLGGKEEIQ